MGKNEVISVLATMLHDKSEFDSLRIAAADALGYGGFSSARDELLKVVQDDQTNTEIRAAAIRALGHTLITSK